MKIWTHADKSMLIVNDYATFFKLIVIFLNFLQLKNQMLSFYVFLQIAWIHHPQIS